MREIYCVCGQLVANDPERNEHILSHFEQKHCICCDNQLIFVAGKWYQPHIDINAVKDEPKIDFNIDMQSLDEERSYLNVIEMPELSLPHIHREMKQETTTATELNSAGIDPLAEMYECEHCSKQYTSSANYLEHKCSHLILQPPVGKEKSSKIHIQHSSELNIADCDPLAISEQNMGSEPIERKRCIENAGISSKIGLFQLLTKHSNLKRTVPVDKYQSKSYNQRRPSAAKQPNRASRNPGLYKLVKLVPVTNASSEASQISKNATKGEQFQKKSRLYSCPYCTTEFVQRSSAYRHIKDYHPEKVPDPHRYNKPPPIPEKLLENHRLAESIPNESSKPRVFKCSLCSMRFMESRYAYSHMREVHGREAKDYLMETPYACSECPSRFTSSEKAIKHMRNVHKMTGNLTPKLAPKFATPKPLPPTQPTSKPRQQEERYICDYCGKIFKKLRSLRLHIDIHMDGILFKCDFCEKSFRKPDTLAAHRHIHTGVKPLKCDFEDCGRAFVRQGDLHRHRYNDHGIS